jgi:hypothetical protein
MKINLKEKFGLERDCDGIKVDKSVCLREWGTDCKGCNKNPNYHNNKGHVIIGILLMAITVPIYLHLLMNFTT